MLYISPGKSRTQQMPRQQGATIRPVCFCTYSTVKHLALSTSAYANVWPVAQHLHYNQISPSCNPVWRIFSKHLRTFLNTIQSLSPLTTYFYIAAGSTGIYDELVFSSHLLRPFLIQSILIRIYELFGSYA